MTPLYDSMVVLNPKIINNTCDTEENGTVTCIEGKPRVMKSQSSTYFAHLEDVIAEKVDIENHYHRTN